MAASENTRHSTKIGPTKATRICLRKYADFNGRATRAEFWWWQLAIPILNFALILTALATISWLWEWTYLIIFIPTLAVTTRRLHDIGKSGWHQLIVYVPIGISIIVSPVLILVLFTGIYMLIILMKSSMPGTNKYGPEHREQQLP